MLEEGELAVELASELVIEVKHHAHHGAADGDIGSDDPKDELHPEFLDIDFQKQQLFLGRQMFDQLFEDRQLAGNVGSVHF